jgi:hypothetical protein
MIDHPFEGYYFSFIPENARQKPGSSCTSTVFEGPHCTETLERQRYRTVKYKDYIGGSNRGEVNVLACSQFHVEIV